MTTEDVEIYEWLADALKEWFHAPSNMAEWEEMRLRNMVAEV